MDKATKERFERIETRIEYLQKGYLLEIIKLKRALEKCCSYKSQVPLIEIGRENLADDIDNEVMPLFNKIIGRLK